MKSWLDRNVSARLMFFIGIFVAPSLVIPASIISKLLQLLILLTITFVLGRRINFIRLLVFALTVIVFNLFSPIGRVLIEVKDMPITIGALSLGTKKAISLVALFVLSKVIVRKDLSLPGVIGRQVSLTLTYFNSFSESDIKLFTVNPIKKIDLLLRNAEGKDYSYSVNNPNETSLKGGLIIIGFMVMTWVLLLALK